MTINLFSLKTNTASFNVINRPFVCEIKTLGNRVFPTGINRQRVTRYITILAITKNHFLGVLIFASIFSLSFSCINLPESKIINIEFRNFIYLK